MPTDECSFDELYAEVMRNPNARAAAQENTLRREMALVFDTKRKAAGLSIVELATLTGSPLPQTKRLLHQEQGGLVSLRSLVRMADVLGLQVSIQVSVKEENDD